MKIKNIYDLSELKRKYSLDITKNIKRIIAHSCGCCGRQLSMFKNNMSIKMLFEDIYNHIEQDKLKLYVSALDNIIITLKIIYPFIDLTGIDYDWTIGKVAKTIQDAYYSLTPETLEELKNKRRIKI